jgi:acyl-coenzyme A synthetase/AMP-(fatty) acid ligase
VHEAAVIACRHPKWDERPLLVVVRKPGSNLTREDMLKYFEGRVPKWQIPDDVAFVDDLPHTATGKLMKLKLREHVPRPRPAGGLMAPARPLRRPRGGCPRMRRARPHYRGGAPSRTTSR